MECWTGIIGLWGSFVQLVVITGLNIYSCRRMPLVRCSSKHMIDSSQYFYSVAVPVHEISGAGNPN